MQQFARHAGENENPRRLLVGAMAAKSMLIMTPLLKWYLEKGLKVTAIHETVEYHPTSCFKPFVEEVATARRAGDAHEDKAILADLQKLIGEYSFPLNAFSLIHLLFFSIMTKNKKKSL